MRAAVRSTRLTGGGELTVGEAALFRATQRLEELVPTHPAGHPSMRPYFWKCRSGEPDVPRGGGVLSWPAWGAGLASHEHRRA